MHIDQSWPSHLVGDDVRRSLRIVLRLLQSLVLQGFDHLLRCIFSCVLIQSYSSLCYPPPLFQLPLDSSGKSITHNVLWSEYEHQLVASPALVLNVFHSVLSHTLQFLEALALYGKG